MIGRASAGLVPGFFLSAGIVGLICWSLPGPWQSTLVGGVSAFLPVWVAVFTATFQFRDTRRAWLWLSLAAVASLALLRGLQATGLVV